MKKVTIILMALALLLLAMPVMANGNGIGGDPEATIDVNITVAQYAAISADDFAIQIDGKDGDSGYYNFSVLANYPYSIAFSYDKDGEEEGWTPAELFADWDWDPTWEEGDLTPGNTANLKVSWSANPFDSENETYLVADDYEFEIVIELVDETPNG